jgi:hypothetical protein
LIINLKIQGKAVKSVGAPPHYEFQSQLIGFLLQYRS